MAMVAVSIDVISDLVEQSRRRKPFAVFGRKPMNRTQRSEQGGGGIAHVKGVLTLDVIMSDRPEDGFHAFRLDLATGSRAPVIIGRHLGKNSVAQTEQI